MKIPSSMSHPSQNQIQSTCIQMHLMMAFRGPMGTYGFYWIQGDWPELWKELNIAFLELYPILLMLQLFGHKLVNSSIHFHCDNIAIVQIINKQSKLSTTHQSEGQSRQNPVRAYTIH